MTAGIESLNPFLNQVFPYLILNLSVWTESLLTSQSLLKSGLSVHRFRTIQYWKTYYSLNPFLNQVFPYFNFRGELRFLELRLNPFLNQVFPYRWCDWSLCPATWNCLNPFLNQVFPYCGIVVWDILAARMSQSLLKSGLSVHWSKNRKGKRILWCLNPFLNQVFPYTCNPNAIPERFVWVSIPS